MKNLTTLFLALVAFGFAIMCVVQHRQLAEQAERGTALRAELETQRQQIEELRASEKRSQQQRQALLTQADDLAAQLAAQSSTQTNAAVSTQSVTDAPSPAASAAETEEPKGGGLGKFVAKFMQDPQMKKFIVEQQRMMMEQMYNPVIKKMGLSPEETDRFKELLATNMMQSAERTTALFGGSSSNKADVVAALGTEQQNLDEQLRAFLGQGRYDLYKDFQATLGERMQLNQFRQQTADTEKALTDQQVDQLLTFMKEEKQAAAAESGRSFGGPGPDAANLQALLSDEQSEKMIQSQEAVNGRVLERARTLLSPDQLNAFATYQTNQMQMMRMGVGMARKMFSPAKSDSPAPASNP